MRKQPNSTWAATNLSKIMHEIKQNRLEIENTRTQLLEAVQRVSKQLESVVQQSGKRQCKLRIELVEQVAYVEAYGEERKR